MQNAEKAFLARICTDPDLPRDARGSDLLLSEGEDELPEGFRAYLVRRALDPGDRRDVYAIGVVTRPDAEAVEEALAAGEIERARVVLDALIEREGLPPSIVEVEDAVLMAEARVAEGEQRLAKLDAIIANQATQAAAALALARAERLATIRRLVRGGQPDAVIAAIDQGWALRRRSLWPPGSSCGPAGS